MMADGWSEFSALPGEILSDENLDRIIGGQGRGGDSGGDRSGGGTDRDDSGTGTGRSRRGRKLKRLRRKRGTAVRVD
jgi:hypothetical protein